MHFGLRQTSWGWIGVLASDRGIQKIVLPLPSKDQVILDLGLERGEDDRSLDPLLDKIERYLNGEPVGFDESWDEQVGTPFQQSVWRAAQNIPRGQTRTYGQVALAIEKPQASRAVGRALGSNPMPILIPCHRVVAADGSLCGFACGRGMKKRLLELEGAVAGSRCS